MGMIYKFRLYKDYKYKTGKKQKPFHSRFLRITKFGIITIKAGYQWDGCTPKFKLFGKIFGTPDGKWNCRTEKQQTYFGSLIHDALYQYKGQHDISRIESDQIFKKLLLDSSFKYTGLYYFFVRLFGGFYGKWKK